MADPVNEPTVVSAGQMDAAVAKMAERLTYEVFNFRHSAAGWTPPEADVRAWVLEVFEAAGIVTTEAVLREAVAQQLPAETAAKLFRSDQTEIMPLSGETMAALAALVPTAELRSSIPPPVGPVEAAEVPKPGVEPRSFRVKLTGKVEDDA